MPIYKPTPSEAAALDVAHQLVNMGVPVYHSRLGKLGEPIRNDWQHTKPDHAEVDAWRPGMGLNFVTGVVLDGWDYDPRNDPTGEGLKTFQAALRKINPRLYGKVETRSGGFHWWLASIHKPKCLTKFSGVEYKGIGGDLFIPPTIRRSKEDPVKRGYHQVHLDLDQPIKSSPGLARLLRDPEETRKVPLSQLSSVPGGERRDAILPHILRLQSLYPDEDVMVMGKALHDQLGWPCDVAYMRGLLHKDPVRIYPDDQDDGAFTLRRMSEEFPEVDEKIGPDGILPVTGISQIIGESNVGKSPLAYWILLMRVRAGQVVSLYESEMGAARIKVRLRQLGATEQELEQIINFGNWGESINLIDNADELVDLAVENQVQTFLFDSLVSMLAASGVDENDSVGVRDWFDDVAGALAAEGISVIVIDHIGHSNNKRGRGSSDKKPACDFALVMKEESRGSGGAWGRDGSYILECIKDRSARIIGTSMVLKLAAEEDGRFNYIPSGWIYMETGELQSVKPKTTQDLIWETLEQPMTPSQIAKETGVSSQSIKDALGRGKDKRFNQMGDGKWERI